jgi:hypothetical protein
METIFLSLCGEGLLLTAVIGSIFTLYIFITNLFAYVSKIILKPFKLIFYKLQTKLLKVKLVNILKTNSIFYALHEQAIFLLQKKILNFVVLLALIATVWANAVSSKLTAEDNFYILKILDKIHVSPLSSIRTYEEEVAFIQKVQDSLLKYYSPIGAGIPYCMRREPKDLFYSESAMCFDRSRTFEKVFKFCGFQIRHLFLIKDETMINNNFTVFFRVKNICSHAVSEVKTQKGWLAIDSNISWVALDKSNNPFTMKQIKHAFDDNVAIDWQKLLPKFHLWQGDTHFMYGLYSRHGKFYEPFNHIPDINPSEFLANFY